jgi:hypothetical protein
MPTLSPAGGRRGRDPLVGLALWLVWEFGAFFKIAPYSFHRRDLTRPDLTNVSLSVSNNPSGSSGLGCYLSLPCWLGQVRDFSQIPKSDPEVRHGLATPYLANQRGINQRVPNQQCLTLWPG